jgi:hypothetical protein
MRFVDENRKWFTPSPEIPSNNTGKYKNMVSGHSQFILQTVQFKVHLKLLTFGMIDVLLKRLLNVLWNCIL